MEQAEKHTTKIKHGYSVRKAVRIFIPILALAFVLFEATPSSPMDRQEPLNDYSPLVELITRESKEEPLYPFNEFQEQWDEASHHLSIGQYFSDHPDLVRKIQEDLKSEALRWNLDNIIQRLCFVPEQREGFARLFEDYCRDVINYVLAQTGLSNPYSAVKTLSEEKPEIPSKGITVFLVHNLAKEYVATYVFSSDQSKRVRIRLKGKAFLGEVGSYTTYIEMKDDQTFELERDTYTIWQNSAVNPYTALLVPMEETLHIALREHTNRAIMEQLKSNPAETLEDMESIVEEWMATEEALVGGVVHALLPRYLKTLVVEFPDALVEEDLEAKTAFRRYRYLRRGIALVKIRGLKRSLEAYKEDPMAFRELILEKQDCCQKKVEG